MFSRYVSTCVLAFSLAATVTNEASAGSYDLGTLTNAYTYVSADNHRSSSERFADIFVASDGYTGGIAASVKNLPLLEPFFDNRKDSLVEDIGVMEKNTPYSDFERRDYTNSTGSVSSENRNLDEGFYPSSFVSILSPDPETTSIAMLLAGLGLVITTARRRTAHR